MKFAIILLVLVVLTGVALAWSSRRADAAPHPPAMAAASIANLETRIPFDIRITSEPLPWCDPIDLQVGLITDETGTVIEETWTVMDGNKPQMTFSSFDDLYYRCDGPDCFRITYDSTTLYVTLK